MSCPEIIAASTAEPYDNELYRRALERGKWAAMKVHGDYHFAEDHAQKGAVALWQAGQSEAPLHSPIAFAAVSARNAAIDHVRSPQNSPLVNSEVVDWALKEDHAESGQYDMFDTCDALAQAVEALNRERENHVRTKVLQLAAAEFTPTEISKLLDISTDKVKGHLQRSRAKLQESRKAFGL